jgi:hypothetical protein
VLFESVRGIGGSARRAARQSGEPPAEICAWQIIRIRRKFAEWTLTHPRGLLLKMEGESSMRRADAKLGFGGGRINAFSGSRTLCSAFNKLAIISCLQVVVRLEDTTRAYLSVPDLTSKRDWIINHIIHCHYISPFARLFLKASEGSPTHDMWPLPRLINPLISSADSVQLSRMELLVRRRLMRYTKGRRNHKRLNSTAQIPHLGYSPCESRL